MKTIYVDIDDTICKLDKIKYSDLAEAYKNAIPLFDKIKIINNLYDKGHVIIYWTARGSLSNINYFNLTYDQLCEWGVKFNELRMGKPAYDIFIDDKAFNMTDDSEIKKLLF